MRTFAKLQAPLFGRGKAKVEFSRDFHNWKPADQMSALEQTMATLRQAHKEAQANHRIQLAAEDARNAAQIRRTA
jgi:hypothetical protein